MRVFYRFAPAKHDDPSRIDVSRCAANFEGSHPSNSSSSALREEVVIKDPVVGSGAAFRCTSAFVSAAPPPRSTVENRVEEHGYEQELVFIRVGKPVVEETLRGNSQFLLAYGQTATGKTHTMYGRPGESLRFEGNERRGRNQSTGCDCRGLVPRIIESLFGDGTQTSVAPNRGTTVALDMGCCEIYNEMTRDLVAAELEGLLGTRNSAYEERCGSGRATTYANNGTESTAAAFQILQRDPQTWSDGERQRVALLRGFVAHQDSLHTPTGDESCDSEGHSASRNHDYLSPRKWKTTFKPFEASQVQRQLSIARFYSSGDCLDALERLVHLRESSATEANARSSRSHFLVRLDVHVRAESRGEDARGPAESVGHLLLIDLAGSESLKAAPFNTSTHEVVPKSVTGKTSSSEATATRTREMRAINRSLLALKTVIQRLHLLSNRAKSSSQTSALWSHIPFKDSALTAILEPYLTCHVRGCGNSTPECEPSESSLRCTQSMSEQFGASAILICCSQSRVHFHNTIASLRLGAAAAAVDPRVITLKSSVRGEIGERRLSTERSRSRSRTPNRRVGGTHKHPVGGIHDSHDLHGIAMYKHECERLAAQCYQLQHDRESGRAELQRMREKVANQQAHVAALEGMLQRFKCSSDPLPAHSQRMERAIVRGPSAEPVKMDDKKSIYHDFHQDRNIEIPSSHSDARSVYRDGVVPAVASRVAEHGANSNTPTDLRRQTCSGGAPPPSRVSPESIPSPPLQLIHSLFRRLSADPIVYSASEAGELTSDEPASNPPLALRARDANVMPPEPTPLPSFHFQQTPCKDAGDSRRASCSFKQPALRERSSKGGTQRKRVVTFVSPSSHGAIRVVLQDGADDLPAEEEDDKADVEDVHPQKLFP